MKIDKEKIEFWITLICCGATLIIITLLVVELLDALNIKSVHWYDEGFYDDEGDYIENTYTTVFYAGWQIAIITSIRVLVMITEKTISLKNLSTHINGELFYWYLVIGFIAYGIIGYTLDENIFGYEDGYHQILSRIVSLGIYIFICYLAYSKSKFKKDKD